MVFNATFNNISVISWQSVLLVEETGENHIPVASHLQTLSHNVASSTPCLSVIRTKTLGNIMENIFTTWYDKTHTLFSNIGKYMYSIIGRLDYLTNASLFFFDSDIS